MGHNKSKCDQALAQQIQQIPKPNPQWPKASQAKFYRARAKVKVKGETARPQGHISKLTAQILMKRKHRGQPMCELMKTMV